MRQPRLGSAPKAELGDTAETGVRITHLFQGQKFIIYAFVLYFVAILFAGVVPVLGLAVLLIAFVLGAIGFFRAMIGVSYHMAVKIILSILVLVPGINILVLLALNSRVTKQLREAGYTVGFLGARKPG